MGKGKGEPDQWVAVVRPGRIIFEISGCTEKIAREAFARASNKLAVKCRMLTRS
jgi:large subunit ribosomal protein L16